MTSTSAADAELVRLILVAAASGFPETPAGELVAASASSSHAEVGDTLVQMVLGARELRRRLAVIEVEAANQARESGITVRRLSEATGISERNVRQRFRRSVIEQAGA